MLFWISEFEGKGFMRPDKTKLLNSPERSPAENGTLYYSQSGVDLTLIRWMLSLTPTERLQILQQTIRSLLRLKGESTDT
jgi:hypothetical protein